MKNVAVSIALLGLLCVAMSAHAAMVAVDDEVILNGKFTEHSSGDATNGYKSTHWVAFDNSSQSFLAYSGGYDGYRQTSWGIGHGGYQEQTLVFAANVYSLTFDGWMKREWYGTGTIDVIVGNMTENVLTTHGTLHLANTGAASWEELTGSVAVSHGTGTAEDNYIKVILTCTSTNAVYWSDLSLTAVPEPTSLLLLSGGLIGLLGGAWRKRR